MNDSLDGFYSEPGAAQSPASIYEQAQQRKTELYRRALDQQIHPTNRGQDLYKDYFAA